MPGRNRLGIKAANLAFRESNAKSGTQCPSISLRPHAWNASNEMPCDATVYRASIQFSLWKLHAVGNEAPNLRSNSFTIPSTSILSVTALEWLEVGGRNMLSAALAAPMVITRDKKSSLPGAKLQHKVKPFVLIVAEIFLLQWKIVSW